MEIKRNAVGTPFAMVPLSESNIAALLELMEDSVDRFGPIDEGIAQSPLAKLHARLEAAKQEIRNA